MQLAGSMGDIIGRLSENRVFYVSISDVVTRKTGLGQN